MLTSNETTREKLRERAREQTPPLGCSRFLAAFGVEQVSASNDSQGSQAPAQKQET